MDAAAFLHAASGSEFTSVPSPVKRPPCKAIRLRHDSSSEMVTQGGGGNGVDACIPGQQIENHKCMKTARAGPVREGTWKAHVEKRNEPWAAD